MPRPREEVPAYGTTQLPATFQCVAISCERAECTAQTDGGHRNEETAPRPADVPDEVRCDSAGAIHRRCPPTPIRTHAAAFGNNATDQPNDARGPASPMTLFIAHAKRRHRVHGTIARPTIRTSKRVSSNPQAPDSPMNERGRRVWLYTGPHQRHRCNKTVYDRRKSARGTEVQSDIRCTPNSADTHDAAERTTR